MRVFPQGIILLLNLFYLRVGDIEKIAFLDMRQTRFDYVQNFFFLYIFDINIHYYADLRQTITEE